MFKKCLLHFIFFVCFGLFAFSQSEQAYEFRILGERSKADSIIAKYALIKEDTSMIDSLLQSSVKFIMSEPKVALKIVKAAEARTLTLGDNKRLGKVYLIIGLLYRGQSATDLALRYLNRSLELALEAGDVNVQGSVYNNIATIQGAEGDHPLAIQYFHKARVLFLQTGQIATASIPLVNIAASYQEMGQFELAIQTYDTVMLELRGQENELALSSATNNLGTIYSQKGDFEKANALYAETRSLKAKVNDQFGMCDLLNNMGDHYNRFNKLEDARIVLLESVVRSRQIGAIDKESRAYKLLATNASLSGDWKLASENFMVYDSLREQANMEVKKETRAKLMTAFDIQAKDAEIQLLSKDRELDESKLERANYQKILFGIALFCLVFVVIVLLRSNRRRSKDNARLKFLNEENAVQQEKIVRQNEDLQLQNRSLEELNREMDGILHVVAHDLKAPINQVAGLANLVEIEGNLNPEQVKYLGMIAKVTDNAGRLVQDLIEISRLEGEKETVKLAPMDAVEACQQIYAAFSIEAARKNIAFSINAPSQPLRILSEENSLRRVLENLVSNALKFSPANATVSISVEQNAQNCRFAIADTGPGFSEADQKQLFQKFAKLSARPTAGENSTGLGLAIVDALVKKLHGRVWVESQLGEGTTFYLEFPIES